MRSWGRSPWMGIVPVEEEEENRSLSSFSVWGHVRQVAVCKSGRTRASWGPTSQQGENRPQNFRFKPSFCHRPQSLAMQTAEDYLHIFIWNSVQHFSYALSEPDTRLRAGASTTKCEVCWSEINRLPFISPAKTGLFGFNKELQFRVCNHDKPDASLSCTVKEGECFYRVKKEAGRVILSQEFQGCWLSLYQKNHLFIPPGLCYHCKVWELPLLVSQSYLNEIAVDWFFCICPFEARTFFESRTGQKSGFLVSATFHLNIKKDLCC